MSVQMNNLGLGIVMHLQDEFSATGDRVGQSFKRLESEGDAVTASSNRITKGLKLAAIAAAAAGLAFGAYRLAVGAAASETDIIQAARGSREEIEKLNKAANDVALANLETSIDDASKQLRILSIQANLGAEAARYALVPSILLAKASMGELSKEAAGIALGQILRQFSIDAKDSMGAVDKMAAVSAVLGTNLKDLHGMMVGAASGANLVRASLDDVAIATALVNRAIPDAGRATMAVNQAFIQLSGGKAADQLKKLFGIQVIDQSTRKMRPLLEILDALAAKTAKMGEGQKSAVLADIFGGRGAGGMSVILDAMAQGLRTSNGEIVKGAAMAEYLRSRLANSAGAAEELGSAFKGTLGVAVANMKANLATLVDRIGGTVGVLVTPVVELLGEVFRLAVAIFDDFGLAAEDVAAGPIGTFVALIGRAKLAVTALFELFSQGGFSRATYDEMQKAGNGGIMQFAIRVWYWGGLIKEYLAGLAKGFWETIGSLRPIFNDVVTSFAMLFRAIFGGNTTAKESATTWDRVGEVGRMVGEVFGYLATTFAIRLSAAIKYVTAITIALREVWEVIGPIVMAAVNMTIGSVKMLFGLLSGNWRMAWDGAKRFVFGVFESILGMVGGFLRMLAKSVDFIGQVFGKNLGLSDAIGRELDAAMADYRRFAYGVSNTPVGIPMPLAAAPNAAAPGPWAPGLHDYSGSGKGFGPWAPPAPAAPAPAAAPAPRPAESVVNVNLHLDGEKIAQSQVRLQESKDNRSAAIRRMDEAMRGAW